MSRGKKRSRRNRMESRRSRNIKVGLLGALAAVVVGLSAFALNNAVPPSESFGTPRPSPTFGAPDTRPVAVFIGDSYTQGTGASTQASRWTSRVSAEKDWRENNLGRGGTAFVTTSDVAGCGLAFCPAFAEMIGEAPEVAEFVVIAGGQNDFALVDDDLGSVVDAVNATYAAARAKYPTATIVSVGPSTPGAVSAAVRDLDEAVQEAAYSVGATYVSLIDPAVIQSSMVLPDGGHVNDSGHAAIAERVFSAIAPTT